jgi:acetyl-CoA carboxylase alpha subunit
VDRIVAERDSAQLLADLGRLLAAELRSVAAGDDDIRLARRQRRYRQLGMPHSD